MSGLTAALLGLTHPHSPGHLRTLQALPEIEAIWLWDPSQTVLDETRATNGAKVVGGSTRLADILAREDVFCVTVAMPNVVEPDVVMAALRAGKHVLAEKPIGRDVAGVAAVAQVVHETGRTLSVLYQLSYHPCVVEARRLVESGLVGPLVSQEVRLLTTQVRFRDPTHWLFSQAQAGGGILSWLGCHMLYMLRHVSGDPIVQVAAEMATLSGEAIDVEDVISIAFKTQSGVVGAMHMGYTMAMSGGGYFHSGYDAYIGFRGHTGRIYWDPMTRQPPHLYAESSHPAWAAAPWREFDYKLGESEAYGGKIGEAFVRQFLAACHGQASPPTTIDDALYVARVTHAVYAAARTGRRVTIEQ